MQLSSYAEVCIEAIGRRSAQRCTSQLSRQESPQEPWCSVTVVTSRVGQRGTVAVPCFSPRTRTHRRGSHAEHARAGAAIQCSKSGGLLASRRVAHAANCTCDLQATSTCTFPPHVINVMASVTDICATLGWRGARKCLIMPTSDISSNKQPLTG